MVIKKPDDIKSSEITDKSVYMSRRNFMRGAALAASTVATGLLYRKLLAPDAQLANPAGSSAPDAQPGSKQWGLPGEDATPYQDITHYNNFYEFGTDKYSPARRAQALITRPWTVSVEGLVNKPKVFDIDELTRLFAPEDRIYRLRCVEGWSMVISWFGFPLVALLQRFKPTSKAKYVEMTTLLDPKQMPGQRYPVLEWPYVEGLRIDEAMHPLTLLTVRLYRKPLPNQNGAPLRRITQ